MRSSETHVEFTDMTIKNAKLNASKKSAHAGKELAQVPAPSPPPLPALPPDPDRAEMAAKAALLPSVNAAVVIAEYSDPLGQHDWVLLGKALGETIGEVQAGDMRRPEAMLYAQAAALQSIFMNFSRRALNQDYQAHLESFFRMAMKAQNQCRMTLETLATIKNPPVVFAKQANINNGGQQQVNNGAAPVDGQVPTHVSNPPPAKNELLEKSDGQRLDFGAQGKAGGADTQLEAVAAVNRAAKH